MFNTQSGQWVNLNRDFPCTKPEDKSNKFTCAYLRSHKSVILEVGNCMAILNVTSYTWKRLNAPMDKGIVFNIDSKEENVIYIGHNGTTLVYEVN